MTCLQLQNITKTFHGDGGVAVRALDGINLRIEQGAFVVMLGSNGSGKSTLLQIIAGADAPDNGTVYLDGQDITQLGEHQRAASIGRVFQNPLQGTVGTMSVEENLALAACRGRRFNLAPAMQRGLQDEIRQRLEALGIGLENRMKQPIATLSGGQRQIVTLLMAAWHQPRLLLLDEHTAALDPQSAELVLRMTGNIVEQSGITVVMVTHSMEQAVSFGDRLMIVHHGKIVLDLSGVEKHRAQPDELRRHFEELRRTDLLDESVALLLRDQYV
ncbi:MAG: ABC transporter ATP-binding protein [Ignavibacteria bacterium]|nr:MAG: ABC transporter ATP-binding protein [Ignavibacteria bacterium]